MPRRILPWYRIAVLLSGTWLLFRQWFELYRLNESFSRVTDYIAIGFAVSVLLRYAYLLKPHARRHLALAFAVLFSGMFVLQLNPHAAHPEHVLWTSSVVLFGSRILPLMGLLSLVLTAHHMPCATAVLVPVRRWTQLSRPVYTTIAAILAFSFSWAMAEFGYGGLPVVDDGVAHLFQAKIFAAGRLALPPPPHPEAFSFFGIIQEPSWMAMFPPGYPALLALAVSIGGISLVNPLLTALSVPAIELIAGRSVGKKAATIAVLLFAFSPFVPIIGGSFRSHSLGLLLLAWSTAFLLDPQQKRWSILLSGGLAGLAFLSRPYTAFLWCIGLVLGLVANRRGRVWHTVALFGLSALPGFGFAILYNLAQTGGEIIPAPVFLFGEEFGLGFGTRVMGEHTVLRGISYTTTRIEALGRMIVGWPFSVVFLPLAVLALPGKPLQSRKTRWVLLLPVVSVLLGYALYWCLEFTHGPRFLYCILATMLPLCAESFLVLRKRLCSLFPADRSQPVTRVLALGLLLSIIYACAVTWPQTVRVFGRYHESRPDLAECVKTLPSGEKLILFTPRSKQDSGFGAGLLLNDLSLSGDLVVALDLGEEKNREVINLFPNRTVYRYQFDPIIQRGSLERYGIQKTEEGIYHPSTPSHVLGFAGLRAVTANTEN